MTTDDWGASRIERMPEQTVSNLENMIEEIIRRGYHINIEGVQSFSWYQDNERPAKWLVSKDRCWDGERGGFLSLADACRAALSEIQREVKHEAKKSHGQTKKLKRSIRRIQGMINGG